MINDPWIKPGHWLSATLVLVAITASIPLRVEAGRVATPEFLRGETRPKSVALLPLRGPSRSPSRVIKLIYADEALEKRAGQSLAKLLREKGYAVKALTKDEVNADRQLRELVLHANKRFDEEWQLLWKRRGKVKKRRYRVGADASLLASKLEVDGVIFARIFISRSGSAGSLHLYVSVVNGTTGHVEAFFAEHSMGGGMTFKYLLKNLDRAVEMVMQKINEDFPAADRVIKAKGSTLKASAKSPKDKDATITELETLLGKEDPADKKEKE